MIGRTPSRAWISLTVGLILLTLSAIVLPGPASAYVPRAPILIDGDAAFTAANGVIGGSGTPSDPYIIEGWEINASTDHGIAVQNTNSHFVIRNVYIHSDTGPYAAIRLRSVGDGRVESALIVYPGGVLSVSQSVRVVLENNTLRSGGISVDSGTDIVISENDVRESTGGIGVTRTSNVTVSGNNLSSNSGGGVLILRSPNATVTGNWIENNGVTGIWLDQTDNVTLSGNAVLGNSMAGLYAALATNVTIVGNRFANNTWGLRLLGSRNVTVHHNYITDNRAQAVDDQGPENVWDDGYPSGGNYWSDYGGLDNCSGANQDVCPDPDGIGDVPRVIDGDSSDRYPFFTGSPGPNEPPTITVSNPSGGEVFSGGSAHTIGFQVSDPNDPWGALRVWFNYSTDDGASWTPIAGAQGVPPGGIPPWTTPTVNTMNAIIRGEVLDPGSLRGSDTSGSFAIDAIRPAIVSTSPVAGDISVSVAATVVLTFSEGMNRSAMESAITFRSSSGAVAFSVTWSGPSAFLDPAASLSPGVRYWVNVSSGAKDGSSPGNVLLNAPYSLEFVTALAGDTTPPVADAGGPYQGQVDIPVTLDGTRSTDDTGIVNWTWTLEVGSQTVTLYGPSPDYSFDEVGTFVVTLIVRDAASNVASDSADVRVVPAGPGGLDVSPWIIWIVMILVVAVSLALLMVAWKRRRRSRHDDTRRGQP